MKRQMLFFKGEVGAIGVTEDPSALRRWMVAGPEVNGLATEYETVSEAKDANEKVRHHKQTAFAQLQNKLESCIE